MRALSQVEVVMTSTHNPTLVVLSVSIAVLASYTALNLAGRVGATSGRGRIAWLSAGSLAMGVGIWSMHFVAMLAFSLPIAVAYNIGQLLLSVLVAIAASLLALLLVGRDRVRLPAMVAGGCFMGIAIAGMHYIGMASMRMRATVSYRPSLVVLSVAIAIAASLAALWLFLRFRREDTRLAPLLKRGAALVMGVAISGMHYTAMAAAEFRSVPETAMVQSGGVLATSGLASVVIIAALLILGLAQAGSMLDRMIRAQFAATEIIRQSEEHLRRVYDALGFGVIVQNSNGEIAHANPAACHLLGLSSGQLRGRSSIEPEWQVLNEDGTPDLPANLPSVEARRTGQPVRGAVRGIRRAQGGPDRWVLIDAVPVMNPRDGTLQEVIVSIVDITERKHAEEQARESQKLEVVGRLAGGIAHDFNNLLTVIRGYSTFLLDTVGPDAPVREDLQEIAKAADRAAGLTHQLLAYSRRQVLQPQAFHLNEAVVGMENMLRRLIGENITLQTSLDESLGVIEADRGQVEQVIMNLVVNARDAMPQGGKVVIETGRVVVEDDLRHWPVVVKPGAYASLSVSDTGMGMDKETQAHVFEPFFTTKVAGRGTGLGLSTVYGIVKQSGGYIWVYSEPDSGTTFRCYLPLVTQGAVERPPLPAERLVQPGTETILLVEDEDAVRAVANRVLVLQGYTVLVAASGEEAVALYRSHQGPLDLLITDVIMPGINGAELVRQLGKDRPGLKVLFMSGYTGDAIAAHGVLERGTTLIEKPFTPRALVTKVREMLLRPAG
jgi:PAS domain S-box-containing protein